MSPILATYSNPIACTDYTQDHSYFYTGLSGQALIGATSARGTLHGDPEGFDITNHTSKKMGVIQDWSLVSRAKDSKMRLWYVMCDRV